MGGTTSECAKQTNKNHSEAVPRRGPKGRPDAFRPAPAKPLLLARPPTTANQPHPPEPHDGGEGHLEDDFVLLQVLAGHHAPQAGGACLPYLKAILREGQAGGRVAGGRGVAQGTGGGDRAL